MPAARSFIGQLILGGALCISAPSFVLAQGMPSVPGAPSAPPSGQGEQGLRILVGDIELEPITAHEIAGGSALSSSSPKLSARAQGGSLRADGGISVAPANVVIRRELRGVWQYGRTAEPGTRGEPQFRIVLDGPQGNSLVSTEDGVTRLPVRLVPLRTQKRHSSDGLEVFEGDLVLEIPVDTLSKPGRYRGQLRIAVEEI